MRKQYSKSDIKKLIEDFPYLAIDKKSNVVEEEDKIYINNNIQLIKISETWVPHLKLLLKKIILPKVTVDMGAVKFVVNGADIMRPGITELEEFDKNDFIVIVDETHNKPLAVGKALHNSVEMFNLDSGKVIQNLHYIGDSYWEL